MAGNPVECTVRMEEVGKVAKRFFHILGVLIFTLAIAASVQASENTMVTVEAEGSGETKMVALQSAWTDAVRKAVGMYIHSSTEVLNDDMAEKIAAYSRGQVNSFQVLSEAQENGIWTVVIKANIDRDVMQETVTSAQSKKVAIDGTNIAAQAQSKEDKKRDALDVIRTSNLLDFSNCFDYTPTLEKIEAAGSTRIYMRHVLKMDLNKFRKQADELEKLVSQMATNKHSVSLNAAAANKALKIIGGDKYDIKIGWDLAPYITGTTIDTPLLALSGVRVFYPARAEYLRKNPYNKAFEWHQLLPNSISLTDAPLSKGLVSNDQTDMGAFFGIPETVKDEICFLKNASSAVCYALNESGRQILKKKSELPIFKLNFSVDAGGGPYGNTVGVSQPTYMLSLLHFIQLNTTLIAPMLVLTPYSDNLWNVGYTQTCALIYYMPLELNNEDIASLNELTGNYTVEVLQPEK